MGRVEGKVALISGAARGMGAAHVRRLVEEGARVVVADVLDEDAEELATDVGDAALAVHLDVAHYPDWERAVGLALDRFGRLDILVNNAGITNYARVEEYPLEAWHTIIAVNLTGVFYGIRAAVPAMRLNERGSIVNISSTAGIRGYAAMPGYTASKFGVRGLTKSAALDLGRYGIRVNSVHPGVIRTPMMEGREPPRDHVALGRMGEPHEVADVVLHLASDESSFTTGMEFVVDGGESAGVARDR
jgi:3alpha(or 20beta)-hydroxysteroid dehydrogenase